MFYWSATNDVQRRHDCGYKQIVAINRLDSTRICDLRTVVDN